MFEIVYNLILLTNIQHKFKLNFTDATKEELLKKVDLRKLKKGEKDVLQEFVEVDNITFMQYISKKYKYTSSQSIEFNENINNLTTEKVELAKEVLKNTKEVPEKHDSQSREELIKETSPTQELVKESSKSNMKKKKEEPKFIENEESIESIHSSEMKKKQESVNESQKSIEKTSDEENVETVESEEPPKSTKKKKKKTSNQESIESGESEEPPKSIKEKIPESSELLLKPIETCYKKKIYYDNNKYYFSKEGLDNYSEYFLCNFKDIYNETGEKINTAVISYRNPSDSELIQWDIFKTNLMVNEEDVPESENLVDIYINTDSGEISEFYKKNFKHMYVCNTYIVNTDDLQYILEIQLPNN